MLPYLSAIDAYPSSNYFFFNFDIQLFDLSFRI